MVMKTEGIDAHLEDPTYVETRRLRIDGATSYGGAERTAALRARERYDYAVRTRATTIADNGDGSYTVELQIHRAEPQG